jgi:hypothetical protein
MNLTVSIDDETLKRARMRAVTEDTSVNAVVRDFLGTYADHRTTAREATEILLKLARESNAGSGPGGRTWTRDDIYDRPVFRR